MTSSGDLSLWKPSPVSHELPLLETGVLSPPIVNSYQGIYRIRRHNSAWLCVGHFLVSISCMVPWGIWTTRSVSAGTGSSIIKTLWFPPLVQPDPLCQAIRKNSVKLAERNLYKWHASWVPASVVHAWSVLRVGVLPECSISGIQLPMIGVHLARLTGSSFLDWSMKGHECLTGRHIQSRPALRPTR